MPASSRPISRLICDTGMWDRETPAISSALRGLVGEEVTIKAADRDLHSGVFGGAAANPIRILAKILADLHDEDGRVTLPGFYDGVEETPAQVLKSWETLGETAETFLGPIGLSVPAGEKGRSVLELVWARPTAEFNGIIGGYTGKGFKTVIAAEASAKISFRLVHKQDPEKIRAAFRAFVRERLPADCSVEFSRMAARRRSSSPTTRRSSPRPSDALSDEWPKPAVMIGQRRLDPGRRRLPDLLGMDSLLVGFGLDDDRIHSPNEKYDCSSSTRAALLGAHSRCARRAAWRGKHVPMTIQLPPRPWRLCHDLADLTTMPGRWPSTPRRWG